MKTAVVFYSWSGNTRRMARAYARKTGAILFEVKDKYRHNTLGAYLIGCFEAALGLRTPTRPFDAPLGDFERIIIMAPVWAAHPAPAINTVFDALPEGREVAVCLVSGSGHSGCRKLVREKVESKGCKFIGFKDLRALGKAK